MATYSLDHLVSEVAKTLMIPNPQSIRIPVIHSVKDVMMTVGEEFTCRLKEGKRIEIKNHRYVLDDEDIYPVDFGYDEGRYCAYQITDGQRSMKELAFRSDDTEVIFPNIENGFLYMKSYSFYEDDNGNMVIPDFLFSACQYQCIFKLLTTRPHLASNPLMQLLGQYERLAEKEITKARARGNRTTVAKKRNIRLLRG